MNCSNFIDALNGIEDAIRETAQSVVNTHVCCDQLAPPSPVPAPPEEDMPTPQPDGSVQPPAGYTEEEYVALMCNLLNYVLATIQRFVNAIDNLHLAYVLVALAASALAAIFPEAVSTAIGTISFTAIAAFLLANIIYADAIKDTVEEWNEWLTPSKKEELAEMACSSANLVDWVDRVLAALFSELESLLVDNGVPDELVGLLEYLYEKADVAEAWVAHVLDQAADWEPPLPTGWEYVECACGEPADYTFDWGTSDEGQGEWEMVSRAGLGSDYIWLGARQSKGNAEIRSFGGIWASAVSQVKLKVGQDGLGVDDKDLLVYLMDDENNIIEDVEVVADASVLPVTSDDEEAIEVSASFVSGEIPRKIGLFSGHGNNDGVGSINVFSIEVYYT